MASGGFAAQRLFFRLGHSPSPKHPTSTTVSIRCFSLSVLVVAYTTVLFYSFYSLVSCHPIDARFIGVHDHHSQVLKPLRPG